MKREEPKMSERFPEIDWYCDRCNAYLNDQPGFDDHHYVWKCTECGHKIVFPLMIFMNQKKILETLISN